jgi:hypothetical protein
VGEGYSVDLGSEVAARLGLATGGDDGLLFLFPTLSLAGGEMFVFWTPAC